MGTKVRISLQAMQIPADGEAEVIEILADGVLEVTGENTYELSYDETEATGLEGTKTTFLVQPQGITLTRSGTYNSKMVFHTGQEYVSDYVTPYGSLPMTLFPTLVASSLSPEGGEMKIDYTLAFHGADPSKHSFYITVKPQ